MLTSVNGFLKEFINTNESSIKPIEYKGILMRGYTAYDQFCLLKSKLRFRTVSRNRFHFFTVSMDNEEVRVVKQVDILTVSAK